MHLVKLRVKKEVAKNTMAFFFEKPRKFKFLPGQFIEIHFKNLPVYSFSVASSPNEKEIMITTRMRNSKFKNKLKNLKIGDSTKIDGPFGQFTIHQNKKIPAVFLAGGIGITPFRSIIKVYPNRKITIFYSNRKTEDAAFWEELKSLENKNFKMTTTMTKEGGKHINPKMIKNNVKDWRRVIYYAVGSNSFVQSMADMLANMKIKSENIKTENFTGY